MSAPIRIGALVSGGGTNLQAIIDACEAGRINGQVVCVGADLAAAGGLERARRHAIATFVVDYRQIIDRYRVEPNGMELPPDCDLAQVRARRRPDNRGVDSAGELEFLTTRVTAEAQLLAYLERYDLDLLVLAGFMRNLTPYFIDRFNRDPYRPRIMNIHPALLPAFPGVDGYGDTWRYGCKVGGCTVHFVDYGEDTGPIIGQRCFSIAEGDTLEDIKRKGLELEWQLYPQCVEWFARNRLEMVLMTYTLPGGRVAQRRVVKVAVDA